MIVFLRHIEIEGPGNFSGIFRSAGLKTRIIDLYLGDELPGSFNDIEAVLILGGPMNVYEEEKFPFLTPENRFVQELIRREIPTLGICLGAQLIAKAAGAKVYKAREKEIGWHEVRLSSAGETDRLFSGSCRDLAVFQWHEDTFDLPADAVCLASSRVCENQAFRLGKKIYGLQFHLEVTGKEIQDWTNAYFPEAQDKPRSLEMINNYQKIKSDFAQQMELIGENFFRIIKN